MSNNPMHADATVPDYPLCVDLDGTLLRTDLLMESLLALIRSNFFYVLLLPVWLLEGKAVFKQRIAERVELNVGDLPYSQALLAYLRREREAGREILLVTAANRKFAEAVACHLGLFDRVLASDAEQNLRGEHKLAVMQRQAGLERFDYAADAHVDLPLWRQAQRAILVNPARGLDARLARAGIDFDLLADPKASLWGRWSRALRLHQWLKNLLVFVPLILSHQLDDPEMLAQALLAFVLLGLCASAIYLINDLLDLADDRRHRLKKARPLAAGEVPIVQALPAAVGLLIVAFALGLLLPAPFQWGLGLYVAVALAYSLGLKRIALLDVLILAGLFTLRVILGGAAISVELSFWLLAFSMFLFLSLALLKRYTELQALEQQGRTVALGRGYQVADLETLASFGAAGAYMAVLVLALYIHSDDVRLLYTHPQLIWLLCPLLLYLLIRLWLLARRGDLHEDPVVFVITDHPGQLVAAISALLLWMAI